MNVPPLRPRPVPPRPYWTEPVSRGETLAGGGKFQKIGWLPPNHKPKTKKVIATAKRLWDKYCEHIGVDADSHLLEGQHQRQSGRCGRGFNRTKFLMHEDYQLAYCPLAHITSLAFADDAFENARLTPELLHKLRVPRRLHVLPLRFKKSMSNTPIFRGTVKTVSGVHTHSTQTMSYRVANEGLKRLGELAGYRYPIHFRLSKSETTLRGTRKVLPPEMLWHQKSADTKKALAASQLPGESESLGVLGEEQK